MHSEGITDPFMRAAMIGETLRTAPARNGDSIWSDYDAMITATQALHEVRTQGSVALPRLQAAVFSSGNSGDSGLNAQSDDYLASVKVNDIEDLMNLVLDTFVHRFIFTCRCALEYREIVVFVWDDRKQRWRPKRFCRVIVTCAGTWAWCNFKIDVWVPCGYWWDPLPPCPPTREQMKQAMREGYDKGTDIQFVGTTDVVFGGRPIMVDARVPGKGVVTWCDEGHNSHHPEADVCYRQVVTELGPGQQCCYKGGNLLTGGTSASTPDKVGSAAAVKSNGACVSNAAWVAEHVKQDVVPWDLRGVRAVGEAWYGPNDDDPRFNEWPPSGSETEKRFLEDLKPWAPPGW